MKDTMAAARTAHDTTTPKYVRVYQKIRDDILSGTYSEGSFLPTEDSLMRTFGVSRTTIRNAIRRLRDDNYIRVTQGRGTEVLPTQHQQGYSFTLKGRTSVTTSLTGRSQDDISGQPSTIDSVAAEGPIAAALGVEDGTAVWRLQREKIIDSTPFLYVVSYLRKKDFPGLDRYDGQIYYLYKFLEDTYGTRFTETRITITASAAGYIRSRLLNVGVGSPLLRQVRHAYIGTRVAEYSESYCRPDYMSIEVSTTPADFSHNPYLTRAF